MIGQTHPGTLALAAAFVAVGGAAGAHADTLPFNTGIAVSGYAGPASGAENNGISYYSPSLPNSVTPDGLTLPTIGTWTYSPGLDVPGFTAASGSVSYQNSGYSSASTADIPSGSVGVSAVSINQGLANSAATATASLADRVTFHVPNGGTAVVDVLVNMDGTVTGAGPSLSGSVGTSMAFSLGGVFQYYSAIYGGYSTSGFGGSSGYSPPQGWGPPGTSEADQSSYYTGWTTPTGFSFDGKLYVTDGQTFNLDMFLQTTVEGGATADFLDPVQLSFGLPSDVSFTSASGVLLTANVVPEPSTWAMMLAGFAGLGFAVHRKAKAANAALAA